MFLRSMLPWNHSSLQCTLDNVLAYSYGPRERYLGLQSLPQIVNCIMAVLLVCPCLPEHCMGQSCGTPPAEPAAWRYHAAMTELSNVLRQSRSKRIPGQPAAAADSWRGNTTPPLPTRSARPWSGPRPSRGFRSCTQTETTAPMEQGGSP